MEKKKEYKPEYYLFSIRECILFFPFIYFYHI
uniref:Uncharacterized protein n=1 Tax=Siphoviridae sp. ctMS01 TaxID=2823574 RepID=A0A8S5LD02_9CAUD|nr:MAG TPA: hypothetical protein [Siphoviridae sp. ctMS01]